MDKLSKAEEKVLSNLTYLLNGIALGASVSTLLWTIAHIISGH